MTVASEKVAVDSGVKAVLALAECIKGVGSIPSGHLYARQLDNPVDQSYGFVRENYQSKVL